MTLSRQGRGVCIAQKELRNESVVDIVRLSILAYCLGWESERKYLAAPVDVQWLK